MQGIKAWLTFVLGGNSITATAEKGETFSSKFQQERKRKGNFFAFSSYLLFSDLYSSKWDGNGKRRCSFHRQRKMDRGKGEILKRAQL